MIVAFLGQGDEISGGGVDDLTEDCNEFCKRSHPLYAARWFFAGFSSFFLSFFLLDTAGDEVGIKSCLWAPLLMILLPVVSGMTVEQTLKRKARFSTTNGVVLSGSIAATGDLELAAVYQGSEKSETRGNSLSMEEARAAAVKATGGGGANDSESDSDSSKVRSTTLFGTDAIPHALDIRYGRSPIHTPPSRLATRASEESN
jgi:hypothetical protein